MGRRHRPTYRSSFWSSCLCFCTGADARRGLLEEADARLAHLIQKGNLIGVERVLKRLPAQSRSNLSLVVRRRHLSTAYPCLVDHRSAGSDPFINFYQQCSPVLWAVDCLQWQVLPLLQHYGLDINRPQTCSRWTTYLCSPNCRSQTASYRRFWIRGRYTYQSALDYFFASIYELIGEQPATYNGLSGPSPLAFYFSHLPVILNKGVDVHRIDSVIVFNALASSYDQYLCRYTNEHAIVPDIPENEDAYVEMTAVKRLIENGFSQFECMEYFYPCCNWFGILICLLCHPKICTFASRTLPPIIRQTALLLINFLALRYAFPSPEEFKDSLENLHLRKVYSKRYSERREEFNHRLASLQAQCQALVAQPQTLTMLARNAVRRQLGGFHFLHRLASLGLPAKLTAFVQYVGQEHLRTSCMPKCLIRLAQGNLVGCWRPDTATDDEGGLLPRQKTHLPIHAVDELSVHEGSENSASASVGRVVGQQDHDVCRPPSSTQTAFHVGSSLVWRRRQQVRGSSTIVQVAELDSDYEAQNRVVMAPDNKTLPTPESALLSRLLVPALEPSSSSHVPQDTEADGTQVAVQREPNESAL